MKTGNRNGNIRNHIIIQHLHIPALLLTVLLLIPALFPANAPVFAQAAGTQASAADAASAEQLNAAFKAQFEASFQNEDGLLSQAGTTYGDWYALAAARFDRTLLADIDYLHALETYVTEKYSEEGGLDRVKATEWHRIALTVLALGGNPEQFGTDADGNPVNLLSDGIYNRGRALPIDAQGTNGIIFGLLTLCASGQEVPQDAYDSKTSLLDMLLAVQKDDGGFSLSGDVSDIDTTAMALYTLALLQTDSDFSADSEKIGEAVANAVLYLSESQTESGAFTAYETENAESTAQVLTALCALQIDPLTDARFIKNGRTLLDALLSFRLPDGCYVHLQGQTAPDPMATNQALCALVAYERFASGQTAFYDLSDTANADAAQSAADDFGADTPAASSGGLLDTGKTASSKSIPAVRIVCTVLLVLFTVIAVCVCLKKNRKKDLMLVFPLAILLLMAIWMVHIQGASKQDSQATGDDSDIQVTLSIDCSSVLSNMEQLEDSLKSGGYIPEDGLFLPATEFTVAKGTTAFDLLFAATQKYDIQMEYQGIERNNYGSCYIQGIGHLYEFSCGELSGWMYFVNGESPMTGCNLCSLSDGDVVSFRYTCDLGRDLGVEIPPDYALQ